MSSSQSILYVEIANSSVTYRWSGSHTYSPVVDVTSKDIRCNVKGDSIFAPGTLSVTAGATVGFTSDPPIYHPGPLQAYMAKVPAGSTAATWDGSGSVWFKIFAQGPKLGGQALTWPSDSKSFRPLVICVSH